MPDDWLDVVLRFALYLDLMIVFGTPLFGVVACRAGDNATAFSQQCARVAGAAAIAGLALSGWGLVETAKSMTGAATYAELDGQVFSTILTTTAVGAAWIVRVAALVAWLAIGFALPRHAARRGIGLAVCGAVALATVAWAGHGAMDDGGRGALHLAIDAVHLLAAGMWVGALVGFVLLSSTERAGSPRGVQVLTQSANGFARIGTGIVVTLATTGVINTVLVVGSTLDALFTPYGGLLLAKVVLFAGMLGLAAVNRYRLSPRLAAAVRTGDYARAVGALRRSLLAETGLAVLILALVAWLGVLSPSP